MPRLKLKEQLKKPAPKIKNVNERLFQPQSSPEVSVDGLVGLKPVFDFLITALWTGRVSGERPVSIILVAPPGHGKTSILSQMKSNWTYFTDDLTSREISHALAECPDMTHLMLSDMTSIFNRKNSTAELTCNILRRLIEEGMDVDSFTGRHGGGKRIGFLTAIPPDDLESRKIATALEEGGFASRFIIAKYTYSAKTKRAIHDYIRSDAYTKAEEKGPLRFPERQSQVIIPPKIAHELNLLALDIKRDPLGARAHHHLRSLAKGHALQMGRIEVGKDDLNKIDQYAEFFTRRGKVL